MNFKQLIPTPHSLPPRSPMLPSHVWIPTFRTLLHIQERLKIEHSLQDIIFKTALKGAPPAQSQRYEIIKKSAPTDAKNTK